MYNLSIQILINEGITTLKYSMIMVGCVEKYKNVMNFTKYETVAKC